jgi:hypothetical protein
MSDFDLFNLDLEDFQSNETQKESGPGLYKANPTEGKDNVYRSVIRFLPNPKDPKNSIVKKFSYWLEDSQGNAGYFDCPSTVGEKSIISDTYWKLAKSESAFDQKQAEKIKRKEYYFSIIQIVKDPQRPELEGTLQVFRYPKTLKKFIDSQTSPSIEDIELSGAEPCNVFDLFEGKEFSLKVTLKGGYWNYDECKFLAKSPVKVNNVEMENNAECKKQIMEYLNGSPDLSVYYYRSWSEEQRTKLHTILQDISGNPGTSYSKVSETKTTETKTPVATTTTTDTTETQTSETSDTSDSSSELEDWLNEVG